MSLCLGCTKPSASQMGKGCESPQNLTFSFPVLASKLCCGSPNSSLLFCCIFLQLWLMNGAMVMNFTLLTLENGPKYIPSLC